MKRKLYLLSALLLLYSPIFAQQVSLETAHRVANIFLQNNVPVAKRSASTTNTTSSTSVIKPIGKVAQTPVMYAVSQDSAWVLVSADERVTPILAYSDTNAGIFPEEEDMPDGMAALLDWYEYQIQYLRDSTNVATIHEGWQNYNTAFVLDRDETIIRPLLRRGGVENHWKQSGNNDTVRAFKDKSYNKYCPILEAENMTGQIMGVQTIVGCVAVAMGQVMWYWKWPTIAVIKGEESYRLIREYDWNNMPAEITNETPVYNVDMIAHLLRDVGIAVNMQYTASVSGASQYNVPDALRNIFGYESENVLNRKLYMRNWSELLKENLQQGYPILYSGDRRRSDGSLIGHLFVIDGYNKSNAFHMNYGQDENANGYFMLDEINGEACNKYPLNQCAILNIYPNYPKCESISISQEEIKDTVFVIQNGGGVAISDKVIDSYQEGVIYSSQYVKLTNGFHATSGSKLHIALKDVPCNETQTISYIPMKSTDTSHATQWCNTWNVLYHGWDPEGGDDPYMPYTFIYQLDEDTTINDLTYQKLTGRFSLSTMPSNIEYVAALRFEENEKVFVNYDNTEYLLYDFGAQIGDTLEIFGGIDYYKDFKTLSHVITEIDTLDDGRLQIYSNAIIQESEGFETPFERLYPKIWIEGVGSKDGIVQNSATNRIGSGVSVLLCSYHEGDCIYTTDNPYYAPHGCVFNDPYWTATEEVKSPSASTQKIIYNGQLLILHDGKTYNVMGVEVGE